MAKVYNHPISGYVYTLNEVGLVRIEDPKTEGELIDPDYQILGWVGRTPEARALREAGS